MDAFRIQGGARLAGRIAVDGSKNASLPLMAAGLLADGPLTLRRVPDLSDTSNMARLLGELGCRVDRGPDGSLVIQTVDPSMVHARYDVVKTMRASICVLGPLLARRRAARVSMPGGCAFGARPVDLHLRGLEALGARIELEGGDIIAAAPEGLRGTTVFLGGPFGSTVLGTANVMSAATLARGTTVIESAACEPEIVDLARALTAMGARIEGAGSPRVVVHGVEALTSAEHEIIPDRIVAGTYAMAAGITNGDVVIDDFPYESLLAVIDGLRGVGVHVDICDRAGRPDPTAAQRPLSELVTATVRITSERRLRPAIVTTQPYPGFPTDLQAQMMTLLCLADGNSIMTEKIYPERFMHVAELTRMAAQLFRQGPTVVVQGVRELVGAPVMASDLRASASLVLAGLAARGETIVSRVYHLDRGYVRMEETLRRLGAGIERFNPDRAPSIAPATVSERVEAPLIETKPPARTRAPDHGSAEAATRP